MASITETEKSIIKKYRKYTWALFITTLNEYNLIDSGDIIAAYIDGSAESFLMAKCLQEIKKHGKKKFELICFCEKQDASEQTLSNCQKTGIDIVIAPSESGETDGLIKAAASLGANTLSLATVFERLSETILYNLVCKGRLYTQVPKIEEGKVKLIRPMYYVREKGVSLWSKFTGLTYKEKKVTGDYAKMRGEIDNLNTKYHLAEFNIVKSLDNVILDTIVEITGGEKTFKAFKLKQGTNDEHTEHKQLNT